MFDLKISLPPDIKKTETKKGLEMYDLIPIDVGDGKATGLGALTFKTHPRKGEWVEIDLDGVAHMYEVVMVAHSSKGHGSDIYVKKLSITAKCVQGLYGR